ncbi:hypothetical protein RDWZM_003003 [Blomia tropicalis]|uniref:SCP2 domain-containing protein n=1 Tax=Blomia tropicalis TaxID=40697 RepID=A0A9Q0MG03_BLOTA|nr:hypothetical protein RDWZM_003003 [Blomia tropicalis]
MGTLDDEQDDQKAKISNLFEHELLPHVSQTSNQKQFTKLNEIYLFQVNSPHWVGDEYWTLNFKDGIIYNGKPRNQIKPDLTYVIEATDLIAMLKGKLNSAQAFLSKKYKLFGNIAAAFKLHHFLNETIGNQSEKKLSVSSEEYNHTSNKLSIPLDGLKCDVLFDVMRSRLKSENDLFENMSAFIVQVNVLKDKTHAATWFLNTRIPGGRFERMDSIDQKVDATLTIEDEDYVLLLFGKISPQFAFLKGRMKIKGDVLLLQKLNRLVGKILRTREDLDLIFVRDILVNSKIQSGLQSEIVFIEIIQRLARMQNLLPSGDNIRFNIVVNGQQETEWVIGYNEAGNLSMVKHQCRMESNEGKMTPIQVPTKLDIIIDDNDFTSLFYNTNFNLQNAIDSNRVQVTGDLTLVPKIELLFNQKYLHSKL